MFCCFKKPEVIQQEQDDESYHGAVPKRKRKLSVILEMSPNREGDVVNGSDD